MDSVESSVKKPVISAGGKEVGSVELKSSVFAVKPNKSAVWETVRWQLARRRAGTASVLTRSNMKGGGKKPFRQKGTGNARAGSNISPLWVGGAVVHGPTPRSYDYSLPKRTRRSALCSVLSHRLSESRVRFVDQLVVANGKTKEFVELVAGLGATDKTVLFVVPNGTSASAEGQKMIRAGRNVPGVKFLEVAGVNVYDLMKHELVFVFRGAVSEIEKRISAD